MGQQLNKVIKRRRRVNYLERKKVAQKEAIAAAKPKARKVAPKKVASLGATPAAAPAEHPTA